MSTAVITPEELLEFQLLHYNNLLQNAKSRKHKNFAKKQLDLLKGKKTIITYRLLQPISNNRSRN